MKEGRKTIGILGGMGPEATVRLFHLIVSNTSAAKDADHIPLLIVNDPQIPDRSAFIQGDGESPVPALERGLIKLEQMGADFVAIPCNTAHAFLDQLKYTVSIPVLDMITETANYALKKATGIRRFGLLATAGTYATSLYTDGFERNGLEIVTPELQFREKAMDAIYGVRGIKAGYREEPLTPLMEIIAHLKGRGVEALVSGCTEISLVLKQEMIRMPLLDPLFILARKCIALAGYAMKNPAAR